MIFLEYWGYFINIKLIFNIYLKLNIKICHVNSVFGPSAQYIKVNGGDFVAIEGSNILERLTVSDLRMPYKQILKSILKPGKQITFKLPFGW
jgi:hypothetical protein